MIRTDHRSLSYTKAGSEHNRKLARWWAELQNYDIWVDYLTGMHNVVYDTLNRLVTAQADDGSNRFIA